MPDLRMEDTIAALATPPGEGGIAVLRVSGCAAFQIVSRIFQPLKGTLGEFVSHTVHFGRIADAGGILVDEVLVSVFRGPRSYTGEDVLEISSHGGIIVSRRILELLLAAGARHAEPGEFTRRAFLNGRMDLTQAEAVLDLIKARSEQSARMAARQLEGSLSACFRSLKERLMQIYAHMEAFLDFPEEDLEIYEDHIFKEKYRQVLDDIRALESSFQRGALLREGASAVLTGRPNVGKSSLFNALLDRDRALVSDIPGTTRDMLEEALELGGIAIRMRDTAGLAGETGDPVERLGIERTRKSAAEADIGIFVVDGSVPFDEADRRAFEEIHRSDPSRPLLVIVNKADLPQRMDLEALKKFTGTKNIFLVSSRTRLGLESFEAALGAIAARAALGEGEQIARARHRKALKEAGDSVRTAMEAFERKESLEYVVEDMKRGIDSLRELIGEIYTEDLLDVIFSEFCIGK